MDRKVILLGPMGAGKTTIGKILSRELGWPYIDNDEELPRFAHLAKEKLAEIPYTELHQYELNYLKDLVERKAPFIGGAAASVVDYSEGLETLSKTWNVYLYLPLEKLLARAGSTGIGRQAFVEGAEKIIEERFNRRDPFYKKVAALVIPLGEDPEVDARIILEAINPPTDPT
jgi:shikimate kinase